MKFARVLSLVVPCASLLSVHACTDNEPAYQGILGRSVRDTPASGASSGSGGGGAGGIGTGGGSSGSAGTMAGEGGMGEGGEPATGGSAGTNAGGGFGGTDNPPPDPNYSPACFLTPTQSGEEIKKGTPCTAEDPPLCYRPCGPNQVGWKTETCLAGVYAEGDCTFPPEKDYACYAIPEDIDEATCGLTSPPAATDECSAPLCMSCNFDGFYQTSATDVKEGFCVCLEPDEAGVRRWTCASSTAWPCPFNKGC